MRIALIHNFYLQPGGEDVVVRNESDWLRARGHEVLLITRSNSGIKNLGRVGTLLNVLKGIWWPPAMRGILAELGDFRPDVVHIHNLWYQFNPFLVRGVKSLGIPVVMTLHNFRLVCANALLFREGKICHKCVQGSGLWGVYHKCYRGSAFLSLCAYLMARLSRLFGVWRNDVDAYLCLSSFSLDLFVKAGFPPRKLIVKPNFIPKGPGRPVVEKTPEPSAAFIGRLSEEKGYPFLMRAWKGRPESLYLAGTGAHTENGDAIHHLGQLGREETLNLIARSWVLVVPSVWHETFGLVIAEAFMLGTPVLASANGTFETLIDDGRTGMLFGIEDEAGFRDRLDILFRDAGLRRKLAEAALDDFEVRFEADKNGASLEAVYQRVMVR